MDATYEVEYMNNTRKMKCHFDEIIYWQITDFVDYTVYSPILKNGDMLVGKKDQEGLDDMNRYFNYKNQQ